MISILLYQNIRSDFIVAVVLCKRYRIMRNEVVVVKNILGH